MNKRPVIIPSAVFAGMDLGWEMWTSSVKQRDWSTPESAKTALTASLYSAADHLISKEAALAFLESWIHRETEFLATEKQLRAKANAAYRNVAKKEKLKAAGKDSSPEGVKMEDFRDSIYKKNWSGGVHSEALGTSIRYSRRLNLSPEATFRAIEEHWRTLGVEFDSKELRQLIDSEP